MAIPPELTGKTRWSYAGGLSSPVPLVIHIIYLILFLYWRVFPLALINVGSVMIWMLACWRIKRGNVKLVFYLMWIEVVVHALLCFVFVGWGFGIQYYLISVVVLPFFVPTTIRESLIWACLAAAVYIGGTIYTASYPPLMLVDARQLIVANVINLIGSLVSMGVIMSSVAGIAERAQTALEIEHRKSEALLNNVLPTAIAGRLKNSPATIADSFPEASVLFADIVDFTPLAVSMSPAKIVGLLDGVFSLFDELVDKYDLEKIKTVGDAYMVAAGIPFPRPDHAESIANLALDMRTSLDAYNAQTGVPIRLRLGISSGVVVAGVIGKRRFLYDLWGDTVNTASRMESHSLPGEIQLSEDAANLLSAKFVVEERGMVDIKGKGPMKTFWLRRHLAAA